jgi:hypothetical protein
MGEFNCFIPNKRIKFIPIKVVIRLSVRLLPLFQKDGIILHLSVLYYVAYCQMIKDGRFTIDIRHSG